MRCHRDRGCTCRHAHTRRPARHRFHCLRSSGGNDHGEGQRHACTRAYIYLSGISMSWVCWHHNLVHPLDTWSWSAAHDACMHKYIRTVPNLHAFTQSPHPSSWHVLHTNTHISTRTVSLIETVFGAGESWATDCAMLGSSFVPRLVLMQ